jgi:hypothetical protein
MQREIDATQELILQGCPWGYVDHSWESGDAEYRAGSGLAPPFKHPDH